MSVFKRDVRDLNTCERQTKRTRALEFRVSCIASLHNPSFSVTHRHSADPKYRTFELIVLAMLCELYALGFFTAGFSIQAIMKKKKESLSIHQQQQQQIVVVRLWPYDSTIYLPVDFVRLLVPN